jgi:hypothetical protein
MAMPRGLVALVLDIRQGEFGISITYAISLTRKMSRDSSETAPASFGSLSMALTLLDASDSVMNPFPSMRGNVIRLTKPIWRILMHTLTARSGASGIASPRLILREARRQNRKNG